MRGVRTGSAIGRRLRLRDGRDLGYAEFGSRDGRPLLYFHGMPGSRLERHPDDTLLAHSGLRLVTIDRPGYGLSTFRPGRSLLDWPADVTELADHLGLDRFALIGVSGGGPHAAACAYCMPQRLTGMALVSSPAPLEHPAVLAGWGHKLRFGMWVARRSPRLFRVLVWALSNPARDPAAFVTSGSERLSPADQSLLAREDLRDMLVEDTAEAACAGLDAYWWDLVLLARPWGFPLDAIQVPVSLWHGEADTIVPPCMGRYLALNIPRCSAHFLANEGHFLIFEHLPEVLEAVTGTGA